MARWNQHGSDGLTDRRKDNGPANTLTSEQQAKLFEVLQAERATAACGPRPVGPVRRGSLGIEVVPQTGWRWLRGLGFSLRVPRPKHPKAATVEQQRVWL